MGTKIAGWGTIAIIVAVGSWVRFRYLGADSLWLDEAVTWQQSNDSLADLIRRTANDTYPPLNNLLVYGSINLFGDREWALRLPSAILGTANIFALYWLGSMTVGRVAALLAAAFLALSGFHVWYSQEARMYALLALAATLFAASSFYFVRSPTIARVILVGISGLALLYSHVFGALNWIAIVLAVSVCTRTEREPVLCNRYWLAANISAALIFAPWAWLLKKKATELSGVGFWTPYPTLAVIYTELNGLFGGRLMGALLLAGIALALIPKKRPSATSVLAVWAVMPILLAYFASLVSTPIFISRYLIGALPAILLLAAYGLTRFASGWARTSVASGIAAAILITSFTRYATAPREDWRGVAAMLEERLRPSDCVLVHGPAVPLDYYYRKQLPCLWAAGVQNAAVSRIFVISSHRPKLQADQILESLRGDGWVTAQEFMFQDIRVLELKITAPRPDRSG